MENLPKGLRIDHGYVQVRLQSGGLTYCKNFGKDDPQTRKLATIHLYKKREEILLGKFGVEASVPTKLFRDVADQFYGIWSVETDPEGRPKHTDKSRYDVKSWLNRVFKPAFGHMPYHTIRPLDVQRWRDGRVKVVMGTSANREQAILSSLFNHVEAWVKSGKIKPFKLPDGNPCEFIEKAKTQKRERVLSTQELAVLKAACIQAGDPDLWEICKMAIKSLLRKKDLMRLEAGLAIDMEQAKTGVRVNIPVQVLRPLDYTNFRKRWESVRRSAAIDDCQFRDLRKTGANLLKMQNVSNKLISEFLGHTNTRTTETYLVANSDHLKPLADALSTIVDGL